MARYIKKKWKKRLASINIALTIEQRKNYWRAAKLSGQTPSNWARHWLDVAADDAPEISETPHPAHPAEHVLVGVSE